MLPLGNVNIFSVQEVHAATMDAEAAMDAAAGDATAVTTAASTVDDKKNEMVGNLLSFLDAGLKIIYIILWPLLFVCGLALDNSLVYGSIFNLDVPLWKFWNMMKNFANFAL